MVRNHKRHSKLCSLPIIFENPRHNLNALSTFFFSFILSLTTFSNDCNLHEQFLQCCIRTWIFLLFYLYHVVILAYFYLTFVFTLFLFCFWLLFVFPLPCLYFYFILLLAFFYLLFTFLLSWVFLFFLTFLLPCNDLVFKFLPCLYLPFTFSYLDFTFHLPCNYLLFTIL